jgi:hypothetical protein
MTLSTVEKARAQQKRDVFRRLLDCIGLTPYYAVSDVWRVEADDVTGDSRDLSRISRHCVAHMQVAANVVKHSHVREIAILSDRFASENQGGV